MKAIIYGKESCANCVKAIQLCEMKGIDVDYYLVGKDITKEQLEESVGKEIRTVPQVFLYSDGFSEYVGGYKELSERVS